MSNLRRENHFLVPVDITKDRCTVKLQWLEHLWDYENSFESGVVRADEC